MCKYDPVQVVHVRTTDSSSILSALHVSNSGYQVGTIDVEKYRGKDDYLNVCLDPGVF